MRNNDYWKERFKQLEEAQNRKGADTYDEIEQQYRRTLREIEGKISTWYQRLADNNGVSMAEARKMLSKKELKEFKWDVNDYIRYGKKNAIDQSWMKELENASAKFHISRLEALKLQTQQSLEVMFGNQLDSIDSAMKRIYLDSYYHTAYELQRGFQIGWDIAGLDQRKIEKVIRKPWAADGKNFSERIWGNKQKLISEIHKELIQDIILGRDPQKAIDAIARKMNTSKVNAGRLVMTEEAYFSSAAQKECFSDLDVEEYEIVATLDSHTSDICQNMDGKIFPMKDYEAGVTAPPFHVWCRSCTVPHFSENFGQIGKRAARGEDGKTYYVPADMKYGEWKESFLNDSKEQDIADRIKKRIERMADHEPISILDIKSKYGEEIKAVVENAPDHIKEFIKNHKNEISVINEAVKFGNRETASGIRVNLKKDSINERGKWCSIFHETGHRVDRILGYPSENPEFEKALRADFQMLVKEYRSVYNISQEAAYKEIGLAVMAAEYHSVSDLFGGLSGGKCKGHYGHRKDYWKKTGNLGKEAFAHFFEAAVRRDTAKTENLKQSFPEAYMMFEAMLEEMK